MREGLNNCEADANSIGVHFGQKFLPFILENITKRNIFNLEENFLIY